MWKLFERIKKYCECTQKPVPITIKITTFLNVMLVSMAATVIFSFLPKLVKYMGATEVNAGYYAGTAASAVYVGRLFFSVFWGKLADTIGNRFSTMLAGTCLLVSTLAFGFSYNIYWIIMARFLQGCSMGQIIVSKAILAEFCDDSNMASTLSIAMSAYSVGAIIGPSIGGFLAFPAQKYPQTFSTENIFGSFVILLPNCLIAVGLGFALGFATKFLTNDKKRNGNTCLINSRKGMSYGAVDETNFGDNINLCIKPKNTGKQRNNTGVNFLEKFNKTKFVTVLKIRECLLSCLLYGLFSVVDIGISELFPLLAATKLNYKGMGYSTSDIGTVLMVVSFFLVILQMTVFPKLNNHFGSKKTLIASNVVLTLLCPLLPVVAAITNSTALWICLVLLILLIRCSIFTGLLSINVFVNNSVGSDLLGSANGVAITGACVGRLITPLIFGSLYSWSLTNIKGLNGNENALGFPFNQFFPFYILSVCSIFIAVFTSTLPDRMNFKKVKNADSESSANKKKPLE